MRADSRPPPPLLLLPGGDTVTTSRLNASGRAPQAIWLSIVKMDRPVRASYSLFTIFLSVFPFLSSSLPSSLPYFFLSAFSLSLSRSNMVSVFTCVQLFYSFYCCCGCICCYSCQCCDCPDARVIYLAEKAEKSNAVAYEMTAECLLCIRNYYVSYALPDNYNSIE